MPSRTPSVAIAGASGFVGRALAHALEPTHHVIGLGRAPRASDSDDAVWRRCDLFSLLDAERGLAGADVAVYLVHSMLPSSRLTQGHFQDLDLICADNFARAARRQNVRRIVYLGGLVPDARRGRASPLTCGAGSRSSGRWPPTGVPLVALRASLVIGDGRLVVRDDGAARRAAADDDLPGLDAHPDPADRARRRGPAARATRSTTPPCPPASTTSAAPTSSATGDSWR